MKILNFVKDGNIVNNSALNLMKVLNICEKKSIILIMVDEQRFLHLM